MQNSHYTALQCEPSSSICNGTSGNKAGVLIWGTRVKASILKPVNVRLRTKSKLLKTYSTDKFQKCIFGALVYTHIYFMPMD